MKTLANAIAETKFVVSPSMACRYVHEGAVKVNGFIVKDPGFILAEGEHHIVVGKNKVLAFKLLISDKSIHMDVCA